MERQFVESDDKDAWWKVLRSEERIWVSGNKAQAHFLRHVPNDILGKRHFRC